MRRGLDLTIGLAGAVSGSCWFLLALGFDKRFQDFNFPVIATNSAFAVLASWSAAMLTGVVIAAVFRRPILEGSRRVFFMLPLLTLPTALTMFAVLGWLAWLGFGVTNGISPLHRLVDFLSFFILYGLVSLFTPILFCLALLNQWAIRKTLGHAT